MEFKLIIDFIELIQKGNLDLVPPSSDIQCNWDFQKDLPRLHLQIIIMTHFILPIIQPLSLDPFIHITKI